MYLIRIAIIFLVAIASARAQQPDPAFLQRALTAVQTQRNLAMDAAAVAEARAAGLTDDLAKANARLKELEPKPEKDKP